MKSTASKSQAMKLCYVINNAILASKGPYKHSIEQMLQSSSLRIYGLEQERVDLSQLKKDLDYWLESLQDLLDGDCPDWNSSSRFLSLQKSEQKLCELKFKYARGRKPTQSTVGRFSVRLPVEEMRRRVAQLVKGLRDFWIAASILYTERVAKSTSSMGQRKLRCNGVVEL
ncbi:uncharacterized protein LOC100679334 [Nasonia vitripennis]|uniref:Uncharacterized protein n=1 Tax=Nasonia vitripennis TaxID=7425 RepID=A0A7M7GE23_NASVI|nr:uncharacterized protein LOC100679334 [Nasonia vitripennis]